MNMSYLALIGDICGSRKVADRAKLQQTLASALAHANTVYHDALASPLTITLGDEFQALFTEPGVVWELIGGLQRSLRPVDVRFGLGIGALETPLNPQAALGMDGPAFHLARDAVNQLKADDGFYRLEGLPGHALINGSLALIAKLQKTWQDNRFAVYHDYLRGVAVPNTAGELGISKTAVYKNINEGLLEDMASIQRAIAEQMHTAMLQAQPATKDASSNA